MRDLSGMPNLRELLEEARSLGYTVEYVYRTGEVRVIAPHGRVNCNSRKKGGNRALLALVRRGRRAA